MSTLPTGFAKVIVALAPLFSKRVFQSVQILLKGAVLAVGNRTVAAGLRVMGLSEDKHFQTYHRILNRAVWSSLEASRIVLLLLVRTFLPSGPLVVGLDDTIERRWGQKISARGIYRDPVRSSHSHFVKTSGLRWLCMMLLTPIPWAKRVWALPFLTALCPSVQYNTERGKQHKKLTDWARQMIKQLKRWCPKQEIIVVADSSFSSIEFLGAVRAYASIVTRLRLDAALFAAAAPTRPGQKGRPRIKGDRLPKLAEVLKSPNTVWQKIVATQWYANMDRAIEFTTSTAVWYHSGMPAVPIRWVLVRDPLGRFKPQAFLCTDLHADPLSILRWFIMRWRVEVTFEQARAHLGIETQRQWSDIAIARTTPTLFALYSLITIAAHDAFINNGICVRSAAWYLKPLPTFSDAIATVRRSLWRENYFSMSIYSNDSLKSPQHFFDLMTDTLAYAA